MPGLSSKPPYRLRSIGAAFWPSTRQVSARPKTSVRPGRERRPERRPRQEGERHVHDAAEHQPGGERAGDQAEERGRGAEQQNSSEEKAAISRPRVAPQRLQDHRVLGAPALPGRRRPRRSTSIDGSKGDRRCARAPPSRSARAMPSAVSIASLTRITVTGGKAATTALRKASSSLAVVAALGHRRGWRGW